MQSAYESLVSRSRATGASFDMNKSRQDRPSAVAVLSNIIYSKSDSETSDTLIPAARILSTSKSSCAEPRDLPTEILLSIFRLTFEACVEDNESLCHAAMWLEDDPLSPSLFPYSLASVCTRWLRILSSIPAYWTRQVITVDAHATPLFVAQMLLQWAGDHPLKFIVASHPGSSVETETDEYMRVQNVLGLLRSHIDRVQSLTFSVKYSSSVPAIWREEGDARHLCSLTLMSATRGTANLPRLPDLRYTVRDNGPLVAHLLKEATLGGYFFNDALSLGKQRQHWFGNITCFTLRDYTSLDRDQLSLYGFVSTLQTCLSLQKLTIENIDFVNDVHASYRFRLDASVVRIHKVTDEMAFATLISQSLGTRRKETVTISECRFRDFGIRNLFRTNLSSAHFTLDSLDANCVSLERLICFWNGEHLSLVNCPGVSSAFMRGIHADNTPSRLRCVRIVNCEHADAEGLISWARSREVQSEIDAVIPGDFDAEPCTALDELQVHGKGPPISSEQALWFSQHLETFAWDTIAIDGFRYTWDTLARKLVRSVAG